MNYLSTLSADVPDPTDFPVSSIAPGLRALDSSLRCNICSELFEGPVTLPCGHCFCSCCIRTAMADKQACPNCRKAANEGHLRINPGMEEAVSAWKLARPFVLQLSKDAESRVTRGSQQSPKKKQKSFAKRKRSPESVRSSSADIECVPGPSKSGKLKQETKDSDDDMEVAIPTSDSREDEMPAHPREDPLVDCPLCCKRVKISRINIHMDNNCASIESSGVEVSRERRSKKSEWSKIMGPRRHGGGGKGDSSRRAVDLPDPEPLPKASYATLKDKQLKDMLLEHKLPVTGERSVWNARHQRWVTIYNANLDRSSNRKTTPELRKDLKKWEDGKKVKKNTVNDVAAYQKTHRTEFATLIEAARPKKTGYTPNNTEASASTKTNSGVQKSLAERHAQLEDEGAIVVDSEEERL